MDAYWRRCAHRTCGARRLSPPSQHLRPASYTPYFYSFLKWSFAVGGCDAKGSVPSVCAPVEGLGGVDKALAPLRPLGDMQGNQAGWRVSRVMQTRASGLRENPLEC
ncbi:hypothetical protein BU14_0313s0013 [Porphyra umbilicalis]|uniref:Uncharacterized protein n=1 Tax=Porphyra umbilicalis TaxID=2786 RepID=A0A1X6NZJ1_PORUM|nr:hypothetical protein BU14_0313s0013 [Porphyra umbilicalis]|eukprot:OSX74028.1 hypothetical protein BU14_0313s0013 [Porphyra umbilicalis]